MDGVSLRKATWEPAAQLNHTLRVLEEYLRQVREKDLDQRETCFVGVGSTEDYFGGHRRYSGWVMVMDAYTEERVIAFGAPNLFGVGYSLSSHRVGSCMPSVGFCGPMEYGSG